MVFNSLNQSLDSSSQDKIRTIYSVFASVSYETPAETGEFCCELDKLAQRKIGRGKNGRGNNWTGQNNNFQNVFMQFLTLKIC